MISFIETKLFTRLVQEYLSDDEYLKLQQALLSDPELEQSFQVPVVSENFAGAFPAAENAVAFESSTFSGLGRVRFGCSPFTPRTWPTAFRPRF
jgi:hypothetical protein